MNNKIATLGKYMDKQRMLPPSNLMRYFVGGVSFIGSYMTLDEMSQNTSIFPSNSSRVLQNLSVAVPIGVISWYVPYFSMSLLFFENYLTYNQLSKKVNK